MEVIKTLADEYDFEVVDLYNSNILDSHDAKVIAEYIVLSSRLPNSSSETQNPSFVPPITIIISVSRDEDRLFR